MLIGNRSSGVARYRRGGGYREYQPVDTLLAANVPAKKIADYCTKHRAQMPTALGLIYEDVYHGSAWHLDVSLAPSVLLFHGLASVVGGDGADALTEDQRRLIEDLLCLGDGDHRSIDPRLLRDRSRADPFRSFFGLRPRGIFATQPDLDVATAEAKIADGLQTRLARPTAPDAWVLAAATGTRLIAAPALKEAIKHLDIPALVLSEKKEKSLILRVACNLSAPDDDLTTWLLDQIVKAAADCATSFSGPVAPLRSGDIAARSVEVALTLFDALASLSKRPTLAEAVAFLSKGLNMLGQAWPAANPLWRHIAHRLYEGLPFSASAPLWQTWLHLRSRP